MPAGRPFKISRKLFRQAMAQHSSPQKAAAALNITLVTAYKYAKRLGIPLPALKRRKHFRKQLVATYIGKTSIPDLAKKHRLTGATVRYHLRLYVQSHWHKPRTHPKPRQLHDLKIIAALRDKPELFDDPLRLALHTGLTRREVSAYLTRIFNATREAA